MARAAMLPYNQKYLSWIIVFRVRRAAEAKPGPGGSSLDDAVTALQTEDVGTVASAGDWPADASCSTVIGWLTKAARGNWLTKTVRCKR